MIDLDVSARVTGTALLGFYSFDDEAQPQKDDSGNGRTLESAGDGFDPVYDPAGGVAGGGYDFDGGQRWVVPLNINPDAGPGRDHGGVGSDDCAQLAACTRPLGTTTAVGTA